ncbi:hypothetical protein WJX74_002878 [Apatococcus lobatus]|uniref:Myb-like domain-containing protein n=2 Tax=Apatococcus TaxID=904362 RepID=A0AAW1RSV6_9CHLO
MADVKDILGMPRASDKSEAQPKPKEQRAKRPEGMSREAFALLDGSHPIVPSSFVADLAKKQAGLKEKRTPAEKRGQVVWEMRPFKNEARQDGLELRHWAKCFKDNASRVRLAEEGDYPFARLDCKPMIYRYDDEEWDNVIVKDADWTREETEYLLELCEQFQLRFLIIADRYEAPPGKTRSMEDLKARYYTIARQLLIAREGGPEQVAHHTLVKHPFNAETERSRKRAVQALLARSAGQEASDQATLEAARGIENARRAAVVQRKQPPTVETMELATPVDIPQQPAPGSTSLLGADLKPAQLKPGVFSRAAHMREVARQQLANVPGGARAQKQVDTLLAELGPKGEPICATQATCAAYLALRADIVQMLELRKRLQHRQAAEASQGGSEGRGRRAHKGKVPARYDA